MTIVGSYAPKPGVRPHSKALIRGSVGDTIDGRSREGRYLRHCEVELTRHVGGNPSFVQKVLITRAARAMLRLQLLDEKMEAGSWTDHDARTFGGLNNALRLCLRELGVKAAAAPTQTLADYLGDIKAKEAAASPDAARQARSGTG
jgi:hypothetical protein